MSRLDNPNITELRTAYYQQDKYIYYATNRCTYRIAERNGGIGMFELHQTWKSEKKALEFIYGKYSEFRLYGRWQR